MQNTCQDLHHTARTWSWNESHFCIALPSLRSITHSPRRLIQGTFIFLCMEITQEENNFRLDPSRPMGTSNFLLYYMEGYSYGAGSQLKENWRSHSSHPVRWSTVGQWSCRHFFFEIDYTTAIIIARRGQVCGSLVVAYFVDAQRTTTTLIWTRKIWNYRATWSRSAISTKIPSRAPRGECEVRRQHVEGIALTTTSFRVLSSADMKTALSRILTVLVLAAMVTGGILSKAK
jgi:hypothetical protein